MKLKELLKSVLFLSLIVSVASCGEKPTPSPSETPTPSSSETPTSEEAPSISDSSSEQIEPSENLPQSETTKATFESLTCVYDGTEKSLKVEGLPDDAVVTYVGNNKTEPGKYNIRAKVEFSDGSKRNFSAQLIIEKCESIVTAESVQEAFAMGGALPSFTLNNTEQEIIINPIFKPGVYEIDIYAKENAHYKESNHVVVTFTVKKGNDLGVVFEPQNATYDGSVHKIEASNIPEGYHVEYENNEAINQGKYYAVCKVLNQNNEVALTLNALLSIDNTENEEFNEYLDAFFVDYLGNDYLAWNIFTVNPELFGQVRDANDPNDLPRWYTYETLEEGYMAESYTEMQGFYSLLKEFENENLSYNQRISYKRLDEFFSNELEYYNPENNFNFLMTLRYIDQFGGYAADVGTYMESYSLRSNQDITDMFAYLESLPEAFRSYLLYAGDRAKAGYPISDYTLDEMAGYLNDVLDDGADYYLNSFIKNKIEGCEFLSVEEKNAYCDKVDEYMANYFMPAHQILVDGLADFKGLCTTEGYYSSYGEVGKALYEYDLRSLLGMPELNVDEYGKYLQKKLSDYNSAINSVVNAINNSYTSDKNTYNAVMAFLNGGSMVGIKDPNEMINYLKEFAPTIVPELEVAPNIGIKYMDDSVAKVSNAVAYYMKSALDSDNQEYITLNNYALSTDYNETLATMAHEGYPGHMYAYLYNKELDIANVTKIMTSTAHAEGWATYVQLCLYEYIKTHNSMPENAQKGVELYCDYSYYNQLLGYIAYAYFDYGINYAGWSVEDLGKEMDKLSFNSSMAQDLYNTLIEIPTQYAAYGYGMSFMLDLHVDAKQRLGYLYDEVEFNSVVLSNGWCSLSELKRITDEYINETLFTYHLN